MVRNASWWTLVALLLGIGVSLGGAWSTAPHRIVVRPTTAHDSPRIIRTFPDLSLQNDEREGPNRLLPLVFDNGRMVVQELPLSEKTKTKRRNGQVTPRGSGKPTATSLAEANRITQTMSEVAEDLRMRFRNLSFLLGLVSAGACTTGRTNRAEPVTSPPATQRPESSRAQSPQPEATKDRLEVQAKDVQTKPALPMDTKAKEDPVTDAQDSEAKAGAVEVVEEKYDNGVVRKRVEGKRNAEGEFIPHGLTRTWYESGLKWTEITFRDGIKHGPQHKWYNTGAEWSVSEYKDGIEHGVWTAYHPNGEKAREIHIDRGVWDGPYIEYHPNGRKNMEVTFVKGLRQGVSTVYNDDGSVAFITDYIDGVEQP